MSDPPSNIRARQAEQVLVLEWDDLGTRTVPYHALRAECPCASCQDEWTGRRILDPATIRPDLKLEGMEPIGGYAVRFVWNDGHGSGLYTWDKLREFSRDVAGGSD